MSALIIVIVSCLLLALSVAIKPELKIGRFRLDIYWVFPLIGAVVLLCLKVIDFRSLINTLVADTAVNPIKILVFFISMTFVSVFLDETGFFASLANKAMSAGYTPKKMFFVIYALTSLLTVFTSNDIIILTFTPYICHFAKRAKINPLPYLVAEFVGANTWSMIFIFGNPTNVYLATSLGVDFVQYAIVMAVPTIIAGMVSLGILYLMFRKQLNGKFGVSETQEVRTEKFMEVVGIVILAVCTLLLALSSYLGFEMWYIALGSAVLLAVIILIYSIVKKKSMLPLVHSLKRSPWQLIPFVLSMFVLVLSLDVTGWTSKIANVLSSVKVTEFSFGGMGLVVANLINNIPMSVLFSSILSFEGGSRGALYATVASSNLGAIISPIGALAGIMWMSLLKKYEVKYSFGKFVRNGLIIGIPTAIACFGCLYLWLTIV